MKAHGFKRRHSGFVSGARLLGVVLLALTAPGARAQFTANNQTNVIDGTVVNYGAVYRVGNMLDEWLPDFLAAAEFGWTPSVKRKGRATIMSSTGRQSWTTILGLCDNPKPKEKRTIK